MNEENLRRMEEAGLSTALFYDVTCPHCDGAGKVWTERFSYAPSEASGFARHESTMTCPLCDGRQTVKVAGELLNEDQIDQIIFEQQMGVR